MLAEIGAGDIPQLLVFNKLDAIAPEQVPRQIADTVELHGVQVPRIFTSAQQGIGITELRAALSAAVTSHQASMPPAGDVPLPDPMD